MRLFRSASALLFVLSLPAAAQKTAGAVEGTVTDAVSGRPVANVRVTLQQASRTQYQTTTDWQGHFAIEEVKPGVYLPSYFSQDYPPWTDTLQKIQVTVGDPVKLDARLMPFATVSGRVLDSRGEPVPGARIELAAPARLNSGNTDEKGKFTFHFGMAAGVYTLSVLPMRGWKPPEPDPASGEKRGWTRTFYPGVTVPEAAMKIAVPPGGQVLDLEFKLQAAPAHTVRGVVLDPDGKPAAKAEITVGDDASTPYLKLHSDGDGSFEFPLVDGEWQIEASVDGASEHLRTTQWIEMQGHDRDGLKLRLSGPFSVRGQVIAETPQGAPRPRFPQIGLNPQESRLRRDSFQDRGPGLGVSRGRPDENGNFLAHDVFPNLYRIVPGQPPPGYYLDSIRLGDRETTPAAVAIESADLAITVVYKTHGGSLRGTAEKCAEGGVLLLPADPAMRRPGFLFMEPCDANDRYEIAAIRPGDYYALEFAGDGPIPWYAAKATEDLLKQAAAVTIRAGEAASIDLRPAAQ